jgi:hypothetical protein
MLPPSPPAYVASPVPGGALVPLTVPQSLRAGAHAPRWLAIEIVAPDRLPRSPTVSIYLVPDAGVALAPKHALLASWSDVGADGGGSFTASGPLSPEAARALLASAHPHVRIVVDPDARGRSALPPLHAAAARIVNAY